MNDQYWSDYWANGNLTSFGDNNGDNYQSDLRGFWEGAFLKFKPKAHVLDLCTGNASLIRLAHELAPQHFQQCNWVGVDYAEIPCNKDISAFDNVSLLNGINVEALPFEDNSFDYVISNFGIEYAAVNNALAQLKPVLKPDGTASLICHHGQSTLILESVQIETALSFILKADGVLDCLAKIVHDIEKKQVSDETDRNRDSLNEALSQGMSKFAIGMEKTNILDFLKFVLSPHTKNKVVAVENFREQHISYQKRLAAMISAAHDDKNEAIFLDAAKKYGLNVSERGIIYEQEEIIAISYFLNF